MSTDPKDDSPKYDLLKVAIAHHRFVWVHPFSNGNGRTVRLFTYAMLVKLGFNVNGISRQYELMTGVPGQSVIYNTSANPYSVQRYDFTLIQNFAGASTVNLDANQADGSMLRVKNLGPAPVNISATIDGTLGLTLSTLESVTIQYYSVSGWFIIA